VRRALTPRQARRTSRLLASQLDLPDSGEHMKVVPFLFTAAVAAATAIPASAFDADAAAKAMKDNNCTKCHAIDKSKKGPSYQKVAAKYKGKADGEDKLTKHLSTSPMVKLDDGSEEEHKVFKGDPAAMKNLIEFILAQ
jgi:cytochrome c